VYLTHANPTLQSPTLGVHTHAHEFWVGMGAMLLLMGGHGCNINLLFMGGHGWASVLCILASNSKSSESNFPDAGITLTKKFSKLKPVTVNDLLFVRSNQDLV
jgi:hypothetical protein